MPTPGTIHDHFCRCRTCKPPLVGSPEGVMILGAITYAIFLTLVVGGVGFALWSLAEMV